jgi:hypothetical protein
VIDLPIHRVTASPVPDGAVASTTFGLTKIGLSQEDVIPGYLKEWDSTISSPVLRHVYISQYSVGSAYEEKIKFVKQRLFTQTYMELGELPYGDRPPRFLEIDNCSEIP